MKERSLYVAPECEEFIVSLEQVVATSGLIAPGFDDGGDLDSFLF